MNPSNNLTFEDTSTAFASRSDLELRKMHLLFRLMNDQLLTKVGTFFIKTAFMLHFPIKLLVKKTIFEHFCGGETIKACEKTIRELAKYNIKSIIEYSVEASKTEASFEKTAQEIIATFQRAGSMELEAGENVSRKDAKGAKRKQNKTLRSLRLGERFFYLPFCVFKVTGIVPVELLEKVQRGAHLTSYEQKAFFQSKKRIINIFSKACEYGVKVLIDAEESWIQDSIDFIADRMMKQYNKEQAMVYNTYQMYRQDRLEVIKEAYNRSEKEKYFIGAKLVRGAYMEKERARAKKTGILCHQDTKAQRTTKVIF